MLMIFFNHRALIDKKPLPAVAAADCDALWLTVPKAAVMTPQIIRQHLHTQRDMESTVAEMRERGDRIANGKVSYSRQSDGRSGTIRFDY